jgi:xylulokinase
MAWVARHHPDIWARTRYVLAPKDYCLMQLTGAVVADPMTSFGVIDGSLTYIERLIALVPGARARMAPLQGFSTPIGKIKSGLPFAGTEMVTGTMDAWAGLFGCGAVANGDAMYLSGTSEILGIVSSKKVPTPGVIAFPDYHGITLHAGPTQSGGASLAWVSHLLGRSAAELSHLVASSDQSKPAPLFLPHLQGERAPLWDMSARGVFAGLDSSMGPAEIARSVMEGVAYSVWLLLGSLEQSAGLAVPELRAAGGGMQSDPWCQIRADVLGKPVRRLKTVDAGVSGAALLAGVGVGLYSSLAEAASNLIQTDRVFEPDLMNAERHAFGFEHYQNIYQQMKAFNGALTGFYK